MSLVRRTPQPDRTGASGAELGDLVGAGTPGDFLIDRIDEKIESIMIFLLLAPDTEVLHSLAEGRMPVSILTRARISRFDSVSHIGRALPSHTVVTSTLCSVRNSLFRLKTSAFMKSRNGAEINQKQLVSHFEIFVQQLQSVVHHFGKEIMEQV